MDELSHLQENLGIQFRDLTLLQEALTHRSYLNESPNSTLPSNERLEFIGDSLLGFVIAERLYGETPELSEGEMTKIRAMLVRMETLARLASSLDLGRHLYLGRGEEASGGRSRPTTLARILEAVIGAVLLDQGFAVAREFVLKLFNAEVQRVLKEKKVVDHKSWLQELVQAQHKAPPIYLTIKEEGPDHAKEFTIEVIVEGSVIGYPWLCERR